MSLSAALLFIALPAAVDGDAGRAARELGEAINDGRGASVRATASARILSGRRFRFESGRVPELTDRRDDGPVDVGYVVSARSGGGKSVDFL